MASWLRVHAEGQTIADIADIAVIARDRRHRKGKAQFIYRNGRKGRNGGRSRLHGKLLHEETNRTRNKRVV
jgi:hypothetical protein